MKGLTLIELLIVVAIMGIIAAVLALNIPTFFDRGSATNATGNTTVNVTEEREPFEICVDAECIVCTEWHTVE